MTPAGQKLADLIKNSIENLQIPRDKCLCDIFCTFKKMNCNIVLDYYVDNNCFHIDIYSNLSYIEILCLEDITLNGLIKQLEEFDMSNIECENVNKTYMHIGKNDELEYAAIFAEF